LELEGNLDDFIQERRAMLRNFKSADALPDCSGELPFSCPKSSLSSSPVGMERGINLGSYGARNLAKLIS
jgi:hypothetical protein